MFKETWNVLGTCGKQVLFLQHISLAKMHCHFGPRKLDPKSKTLPTILWAGL